MPLLLITFSIISLVLLAQPVLVDHIIAICDYYVISRSDIERARHLIEAGVPTILDKEELFASAQDSNKAILRELIVRYLANKKAYQFQIGKEEAKEIATATLDSLKSSLGTKNFSLLLKKIRISEDDLKKELEAWARAKIFLKNQLDMRVQIGKKKFYERNRDIFVGDFPEEEEKVIKAYRKKLLLEWMASELEKSKYRIMDESFLPLFEQ